MTIQEAIETLKSIVDMGWYIGKPADDDAIRLGIEALKRCQELESPKNFSPMRPLPGETKK